MSVNQVIGPAILVTGALDDLASGGQWSSLSNANSLFVVRISTAGAPDQFEWSQDQPYPWSAGFSAPVAITGAAQLLAAGVTVTFAATTGHAAGDTWLIQVVANSLLDGKFRQGGHGAISVPLQEELRKTIRVSHFGAVGDGIADDTAAINAALAYAAAYKSPNSTIGGHVYLGRGVFLVSSTITIPFGVQLIGESTFASILMASADFPSSAWNSFVVSFPGFLFPSFVANQYGSGLVDVQINCGTGAAHISGIQLVGLEETCRLERISITNYTDYGVYAYSINNAVINVNAHNLWILGRGTAYKSIVLQGAGSRVRFSDITVAGIADVQNTYPGITLILCYAVKISEIHPEVCPVGIYVVASFGISIDTVYGNPSVASCVDIDPVLYPLWTVGVDYVAGTDVVSYNELIYICAADHTASAANQPPDAAYWTPYTSWSSAATYLPGDITTETGQQYLCIAVATGNAPTDATYWRTYIGPGQSTSGGIQVKTIHAAAAPYAVRDWRRSALNALATPWVSGNGYTFQSQVIWRGMTYMAIQEPALWSSVTAYAVGDIAYTGVLGYGAVVYICILANTNQTPPNATYWSVFSAPPDSTTVTGWWLAAYCAFNLVDLFPDANTFAHVIGFANNTAFGFDPALDSFGPGTAVTIKGGSDSLSSPNVGMAMRRNAPSNYCGINFPGVAADMFLGMEPGTDDLIISTGNAAYPAIRIRVVQSGGTHVYGGALTLDVPLAVADGGTGAADAATALANLGTDAAASVPGWTVALAPLTPTGTAGSMTVSATGRVTAYTAPT
jgi:hypothetical protein